jgi:hypothetical protein
MVTGATLAQQIPLPTSAADVPGPAPGTAMTRAYVESVGRLAYVWGWPLVNSHNRRAAFAKAPEPARNGGVLPVAPIGRIAMLSDYIKPDQNFVACPNQDVVYGAGFFALGENPVVFQVPDFGDRFWVYALYDARTDEFAKIGKPYGTKPGFYLIVGPDWTDQAPAGITAVLQSSTELVFAIPRVFRDDTPEDLKAVQPIIDQIVFYPLSEFDAKMKTKDWSRIPDFPAPKSTGGGEVKWVDPTTFFDQLPDVMRLVPPMPGEEALYKWIGSVLYAAKRDPQIKKILQETAVSAEQDLMTPLVQWRNNGAPLGNGWNSPVNNARWGTDYLNRASTAKSNMYENTPDETKYIFTDSDTAGEQLHGQNNYTITFPKGQLPPVKGFWSLTLYNEHHFFHPNALNRYSLGAKNKDLKPNADGSVTLYAGAKSPGKDKESNWLPAPNGAFSLYIRAYWPDLPILKGKWMPPIIATTK